MNDPDKMGGSPPSAHAVRAEEVCEWLCVVRLRLQEELTKTGRVHAVCHELNHYLPKPLVPSNRHPTRAHINCPTSHTNLQQNHRKMFPQPHHAGSWESGSTARDAYLSSGTASTCSALTMTKPEAGGWGWAAATAAATWRRGSLAVADSASGCVAMRAHNVEEHRFGGSR